MKNNKIAKKLSLYFAITLLSFSIIIGGMFLHLFRKNTVEIHKRELTSYAKSLSKAISEEGNHRPYLRFVTEVANVDVWILDRDLELITINRGKGHMKDFFKTSQLPENAEKLLEGVLEGKTLIGEGFSESLGQAILTVGTPIMNRAGEVTSLLLLHSPIEGIRESTNKALGLLLLSMVVALIFVFILSIFLSYSFTRPLNEMKKIALELSEGNYRAKCDIKQRDEIGELADKINLLASRLDQASKESFRLDKLRRDFVSNISHELRTPITVIRGSLEALNEKVVRDEEKIQAYYIHMLNETKHLERLVNDLLDLSKLQNMDFKIKMANVDLNSILLDTIESSSSLAKEKKIEIRYENPKKPIDFIGDYGRLRQMFMIVMDNAIKFSKEMARIDINFEDKRISIRDYGPGIDKEYLPYIFDRFYGGKEEENKSGSGLGLAIAKEIADRHKILIEAENHIDGGANFIFTLPI